MKSMKMMNVIIPLMTVMMCAGAAAYAGPDGRHDMAQRETEVDRVIQAMDLTPAQKNALIAHRVQHRAQTGAFRDEIKAIREQLRAALESEQLDRVNIERLGGELKIKTGAMVDMRIKGMLEVREILTPEQFRIFMQRTRELFEKHKHRR